MGPKAQVLPKKATQRPVERNEHHRWSFLRFVRRINPFKLVFLDETSTRLGMRREYGYAPRGERVHSEYLRNFGPNRTLLAAVGLDGVLPSLLIDGGTTGEVFEYYLEHLLLPALRPGQVLVVDNFSAHKGPRVRELVEVAGCGLVYLPSYSPDLNPIEPLFGKLKASLRRAAALTLSALSMAVREALDAVTLFDIQGFFSLLGFNRQNL